ncbi:hypothetical protein [Crocinitomix catalasitica]|uniref:hypothetical protein n=1 Tax=Crocinitomix catalasitica TaxID=184607 RepID=UPI000486CA6E|nr:hypothetical protein [Crocinitomix catalasitica]
MNKNAKWSLILFSVLPILIGTLFFLNLKFNSKCNGLFEALGLMLTLIVLGFLVGLILIIQIYKIYKRQAVSYRIITLIFVLLSVTSVLWGINKPSDYFKSPVLLEAEFYSPWKGNLKLRTDGTYSAIEKHTDWSCTHHGSYEVLGSRIILNQEIANQSDSIFTQEYFVEDQFLIPKVEYKTLTDSSNWLRIIN